LAESIAQLERHGLSKIAVAATEEPGSNDNPGLPPG
jgi:hypothetical protein